MHASSYSDSDISDHVSYVLLASVNCHSSIDLVTENCVEQLKRVYILPELKFIVNIAVLCFFDYATSSKT